VPFSSYYAAGLVFIAVALGTVSLALLGEWVRQRRRARNVYGQLQTFVEERFAAGQDDLVRRYRETGGSLDATLARLPHFKDVGLLLEQGGTTWSLQTYFLLSCGLALGAGFAVLLASRLWPAGLIAAGFGALIPFFIVRRRARRRLRAFEEQLPDAIDLIGRAIRAGHPLSAGMKMVADETADPISGEFRRVFEEQRFGLPFDDSLLSLADRITLVDVRILITAILIQREVGGNLAEVLDNLAYTIRERFKLRRQLRVITAQGRMSGYILALLPIAVGFAIFLLNRGYVMELFLEPVGRIMLFSALLLQFAGYYWIRRIVDIDF